MALPMPPENIKQTASIFNAGRTAMMIPGIPLETVQTPTFPSKPAYSRRNQTYSRYAQAQPARRFGCILGEAHATWLQTLYSRPLPFPKKQGIMVQKLPNLKYVPKPYEQMSYPRQRVQIDVKFVLSCCLLNEAKGKRFYQYTAIDEYSRWRYVEAFEEHSTYSSARFLEHLTQRFPMPIEYVQTDSGLEFTKRFSTSDRETLTLFQRVLKEHV